jgi:diacylglycerol kinase (ATP)
MKDTVFFVNPRAGSGKGAEAWEGLRRALGLAERAVVILADDARAAGRQLDEALARRDPAPRRVIAVGGDGTAHLAANRLVAGPRRAEVALGFVAAGTGSDLARNLGLPREPRAALDHALASEPTPLDLVRVTCGEERRVVLNVASAGISGRVAERVNALTRRGGLSYLSTTLGALRSYRPFAARLVVDGETWYQGGVYLLAVANGSSFGKGMRVAPAAVPDDGLADVVLVRPIRGALVPFKLPRLYTGGALAIREVIWKRARRVRLEPAAGADIGCLEIDGETIPGGAADFELLPGALPFLR